VSDVKGPNPLSTSFAHVLALQHHYDKLTHETRYKGQTYYIPERSAYDRAGMGLVKILETDLPSDPSHTAVAPKLSFKEGPPLDAEGRVVPPQPASEPTQLSDLSMPALRELAGAYGIDVGPGKGTGRKGAMTKDDMVRAIEIAKGKRRK